MEELADKKNSNFIRQIIDGDLKTGKNNGAVVTRFPPEPNGYLHIGHAKSICLNFGIAKDYDGAKCHLRLDDTNPAKEETHFVESIQEDVKWLGFDWGKNLYFASDYFDKLYEYALDLIKSGKAYVCDLSPEDTRTYRGTLNEPGKDSPYRSRSVEENLELFTKMKAGEFAEGSCVLRAKIDMSSPNINLRDPAIYRIRKVNHHRTGDKWNIYPMYDFTHCLSDAFENITHSLCTLEFQDHRPLYNWFIDQANTSCRPQQIEFARLNLTYTVMSKRKLRSLVEEGHVSGWDDPRMPTIAGMRRRGYPSASIREFCERIGVAKADSCVDMALLEYCVREELNKTASRVLAVLDPIKVVITNYPENQEEEWLEAINNPEDESAGKRQVPFSKELYIERNDFMENPPKKFFRLSPGREVRLRYAYFVTCQEIIKDPATGEVLEIHCTYDPATKGGSSPDGRKVKGTIHWVSAKHAIKSNVRLYSTLFKDEQPDLVRGAPDLASLLNEDSLQNVTAYVEPSLKEASKGSSFQFERLGYFHTDPIDSNDESLCFNRIVPLRDTWGKMVKKAKS